jgi:hypothetical protein
MSTIAQSDFIPLKPDQIEMLVFILSRIKADQSTLFEHITAAMMLAKNNYIDLDDYAFQVAMTGSEKDAFIKYCHQALELNGIFN